MEISLRPTNISQQFGFQVGEWLAILAVVALGFLIIRRLMRDFGKTGVVPQIILPAAIIAILPPLWHFKARLGGSVSPFNPGGWAEVLFACAVLIPAFIWRDRSKQRRDQSRNKNALEK